MTPRLVTPETLAALGVSTGASQQAWLRWWADCPEHSAFLAALPPDPRLDALLAALRDMTALMPDDRYALLRPATHKTLDAVFGETGP